MSKDETIFKLKGSRPWGTITVLIWCAMAGIAALVFLVIYCLEYQDKVLNWILPFLIILMLFYFAFTHLLQLLFSSEYLKFGNDCLEVYRGGFLARNSLKINYFELEDIEINKKVGRFSRGEIAIHYLGRKKTIGGGLKFNQAVELVEKMKLEFEKRKLHQLGSSES